MKNKSIEEKNWLEIYEFCIKNGFPKDRLKCLEKLINNSKEEILKIIHAQIYDEFYISYELLFDKSRYEKVVFPRQLFYYFSMKYSDNTDEEIAEYAEFDRSSVMHGARKAIPEWFISDKQKRYFIQKLDAAIKKRVYSRYKEFYCFYRIREAVKRVPKLVINKHTNKPEVKPFRQSIWLNKTFKNKVK